MCPTNQTPPDRSMIYQPSAWSKGLGFTLGLLLLSPMSAKANDIYLLALALWG